MDLDQLDEVFDSEVGERHDAIVAEAVDPDHAVLRVHFVGDVVEPVDAELCGNLGDDGVMKAA